MFANLDFWARMVNYSSIIKFGAVINFLLGIESYFITPTAWYYIKSLGQSRFFLVMVFISYNVGNIICGPVFGFLTNRFGHPRNFCIFSLAMKVLANALYSVNASAYFPLIGRFFSGFGNGVFPIVLGQIALQTNEASRGANYVVVEGIYCLGSVFGPAVGSLITFRTNILGWKIDEGNSPGIVMTMIWLFCLIGFLFLRKDMWVDNATKRGLVQTSGNEENDRTEHERRKLVVSNAQEKPKVGLADLRISCLLFLSFSNVALSDTSAYYVPVLGIDHFHLKVFHVKLLFLNCSLFSLILFLVVNQAVEYVDERKLLLIPLFMDICGILLLMYLAFVWDQLEDIQYYILLIYQCLSMPYLAYPLANSIVTKFSDPENATLVQGFSYAIIHVGCIAGRVFISFVFTKTSLIYFCLGVAVFWSIGMIWYVALYKRMKSNN